MRRAIMLSGRNFSLNLIVLATGGLMILCTGSLHLGMGVDWGSEGVHRREEITPESDFIVSLEFKETVKSGQDWYRFVV